MLAVGQRCHAVINQPRHAAPGHDVAMLQTVSHGLVGAFQAAPQEGSGQAERDRDDRLVVIPLVAILVQR